MKILTIILLLVLLTGCGEPEPIMRVDKKTPHVALHLFEEIVENEVMSNGEKVGIATEGVDYWLVDAVGGLEYMVSDGSFDIIVYQYDTFTRLNMAYMNMEPTIGKLYDILKKDNFIIIVKSGDVGKIKSALKSFKNCCDIRRTPSSWCPRQNCRN